LSECRPYLERQIAAINPHIIITLGRYSMAYFMPNAKISAVHGKSVWNNGRLVVAMYHPAAALHQPALHDSIVSDFESLPKYIAMARQAATPKSSPAVVEAAKEEEDSDDKPVQLSLF
jgi:DNA polymerase